MPDNITHDSNGTSAMSQPGSWMIYGAAGYTGALIAQHARDRGHRPVLAGRSAPAVATLAEHLGLQHRAVALDDPAALAAALAGVHLVLNAAGPFLHTAAPLAEACLRAGVHYLDIGNELQVFRTLYGLDQRARQAGITIMPGAGFGVRRHELPRPLRQRRGRRRSNPRSRHPGRHSPARPRRRRDRATEHALRRLDPAGRPP
jgi:uncharacterized protein YbjT (DUF2867 family)